MKSIKRLFKTYEQFSKLALPHDLYKVSFKNTPVLPAGYTYTPIEITDDIETNNLVNEHLRFLPFRMIVEWTAKELLYALVNEIFSSKMMLSFMDDSKDILLLSSFNSSDEEISNIMIVINTHFSPLFNTEIVLLKTEKLYTEDFQNRVEQVKKLYLDEQGDWTQNFIDTLGDEVSKVSFRSFLKQRIAAHILGNSPCIYPILPPEETKEWREEKCANPPQFPIIEHCSKFSIQSAQYCCFTVEQYGIDGIVSAKEGDNVIDGGAFIGDTALYFSQKVGNTGKVYAFEPFEESAENARDNARLNGYTNIEVVQKAITENGRDIRFSSHAIVASGSKECEDGDILVHSTSIDAFAKERNIKVGYIKSDTEGGEMNLLLGAEHTIRKDKPTLGITLYHKQADYHEIPKLIKKFCPEYTFYFRSEAEPVVFAMVE